MKNLILILFLVTASQCEISEANSGLLRGMEFLHHNWVVVPEQRQHEIILEQVRNQRKIGRRPALNRNVSCNTVLVPSVIDPSIKYEKTVCN